MVIAILSCNSTSKKEPTNKNDIDSCTIAIPHEEAKLVESGVAPGYSGVLTNYRGETTKLDFQHFFKDGKITKSVFYYENGKIEEEIEFKCGSAHGLQKHYYEDGSVESYIPYRYGRAEGMGQAFTEKGKLKMQVVFKADSMISKKEFDDSGNEIKK